MPYDCFFDCRDLPICTHKALLTHTPQTKKHITQARIWTILKQHPWLVASPLVLLVVLLALTLFAVLYSINNDVDTEVCDSCLFLCVPQWLRLKDTV